MSHTGHAFDDLAGTLVGTSPWQSAGQTTVDAYAELMGDGGPIHNDPDSAAARAFGGTIVQGSYLLGSMDRMAKQIDLPTSGVAYRLNYGFDRVRIIHPVPTGARFRAHFTVAEVRSKGPDADLVRLETTIEIEGRAEPALVASWLTYFRYER
ncbi:MAG: MaoC/PaaZ C-terminal domain-containing protein [Acidimicrobiales bacterium]